MTPQPPSTVVSPPSPAAPPAAAPAAVDAAALQAQIDALKEQAAEHRRTAEFWHSQATSKTPAEPKAPVAEPEDDTDVLELITTKGVKGLDEIMTKRGYTKAADVDAKVEGRAQAMVKEQELIRRYPDLAPDKRDSEFFKSASVEYGALIKQGVSPAVAMELAAERVELASLRSGKTRTPAQQTADTKAQKELDRIARIKAQGGDTGHRAPVENAEDDDTLTPEQERIAVRMLAGDGVTPEQAIEKYKARAKKGVAMKGIR